MFKALRIGGVGLCRKSSDGGPSEWTRLKLLSSGTAGVSGNVRLGVGSLSREVGAGEMNGDSWSLSQ